jgi:hypothetical protein
MVPVTMTADVNNWVVSAGNPPGSVPGYKLTVNAGGDYDVTGIQAPTSGQTTFIILFNANATGTNKRFKLKHNDSLSAPNNRMLLPNRSDMTVEEYGGVQMVWDQSVSRWFVTTERKP